MSAGPGPLVLLRAEGGFWPGLGESLLVNSPYFGNFPVNPPQPPVDGGANWKFIINSCHRPGRRRMADAGSGSGAELSPKP